MNKEGTVKVVIQGREYLFDEDKVSYVNFFENEKISSIYFKEPQLISFKIGDVENRDKQVSYIEFYKNGDLKFISFRKQPLIIFKIRNIYYSVKMEDLCFYKEGLIQYFLLAEDFKGSFSYKGEKYNLQFDNGESVLFEVNGELDEKCIKNSIERFNEVFGEKITILKKEVKELQTNQNIASREDRWFVFITCAIGFYFFLNAFCLCFNKVLWWMFPLNFILPENFDKICFNYGFSFLNPEHETFNKYTFFYEILKRVPIIILVILGFKFLQLAFERIRLVGEVEKVQKYIKLTNDDTTKNKLLKIIALPFFVPKKMKSSVKFMDDFRSVILEKEENKG